MRYNLYYGTQDGPLKVQYRVTRNFNSEENAKQAAFDGATSLYYKNEGKFGLPDYSKIMQESKITGLNVLKLYEEHIKDLMWFYVVPTDVDTVSERDIKLF
jgi:hypothetical protein